MARNRWVPDLYFNTNYRMEDISGDLSEIIHNSMLDGIKEGIKKGTKTAKIIEINSSGNILGLHRRNWDVIMAKHEADLVTKEDYQNAILIRDLRKKI